MIILAYFSENGIPKTGLSPVLYIYDLSDDSLVIDGEAMSEVAQGGYKYDFVAFDGTKDYYIICDSVTLIGSERYLYGSSSGLGDIEAILVDTNELQTDWTNAGRLDAILDTIAEDTTTNIPALIDDVPTVAEFEARTILAEDYVVVGDTIAGVTTATNLTNAPSNGDLTATMKESINAEVDAAIETYHLDHLLAADYDPASKPGVATALLNELVENDGGVSRFTENALEQGPDTITGITLSGDYDAAKTASQAGDLMGLSNDAITSAKFDESTAFPLKSADSGSTMIARTGADSDTLETLSDQVDLLQIDISFIKQVESGRWKVDGNQMIFYEDDNETEIMRFNLFDGDGVASESNIKDRQRV